MHILHFNFALLLSYPLQTSFPMREYTTKAGWSISGLRLILRTKKKKYLLQKLLLCTYIHFTVKRYRPFQITIRKVRINPEITLSALFVTQCAKYERYLPYLAHWVTTMFVLMVHGIRNLRLRSKKVGFENVYTS